MLRPKPCRTEWVGLRRRPLLLLRFLPQRLKLWYNLLCLDITFQTLSLRLNLLKSMLYIYILTLEPVPAFRSCTTAASRAIGFYPSFCHQYWPWCASFSVSAQCQPSFHEAFLPPASSTSSRFFIYWYFTLTFFLH